MPSMKNMNVINRCFAYRSLMPRTLTMHFSLTVRLLTHSPSSSGNIGNQKMQPLQGVKVLDFSTLLPGPLCTLMLAEAGADVTKVEKGSGDEVRHYDPKLGSNSANFAVLNRGKKSITVELKDPKSREKILTLIQEADILVEQFRPGVMERLGLSYAAVSAVNPRLIYCSITGFGQSGPYCMVAAHDLNYQAQSGMLGLSGDSGGTPTIPQTLTADIAGGTYPAVINILLALRQRDLTGKGCHIDISMSDNLFPLMFWGLASGWSIDQWPKINGDLLTGGSPRYQIYQTSDHQFLACAALEQQFWVKFLEIIGAPDLKYAVLDDNARKRIADIIFTQAAEVWMKKFDGQDVCVSKVVSLEEAVKNDPHFKARGLFNRTTTTHDNSTVTALPTAISREFLSDEKDRRSPGLGEHNLL